MQLLANNWSVNIIRIYGIAEHGKGEVDHVGGLAKTAVRRVVAEGDFFADSTDIVDFLTEKLQSSEHLQYIKKFLKKTLKLSALQPDWKCFLQ